MMKKRLEKKERKNMKILIDTNVLLDVLCNRKAFIDDSLKVFKLCELRKVNGCISALSIPNIIYILRKELTKNYAKQIINSLSLLFDICDLKANDLITASNLDFQDYEDALQSVCAASIKADYIITRNSKDFVSSKVKAITPNEFIEKKLGFEA